MFLPCKWCPFAQAVVSPGCPEPVFPHLLWSFCCPHPIRLLYPRYLLKGVLFPHCPIWSAPPRFLRHPRPFLNSGKTESSQVAELQPTPVCTVQQALSSCFLPLCLAFRLPPQFLHHGLPALRISVYPNSASENVFLPFFRIKPYSLFKSQFKGLFEGGLLNSPCKLYLLAVWLHRTSNSSCELTIYSFSFKTKSLLQGMHSNMGKQSYLCLIILCWFFTLWVSNPITPPHF